MKIQFITYLGKEKLITEQKVTYSQFSNPLSFSEFDLNIISLQDERIWRNEDYSSNYHRVDCSNHLKTLNGLIKTSLKNTIVFLPQNYVFKFGSNYNNTTELKDFLNVLFDSTLGNSLLNLSGRSCSLVFENCKTIINGKEVSSAFVFDTYGDILTNSKSKNSITTFKYSNNCILSTLDLSELNIDDFLREIGSLQDISAEPEWIKEVYFYDDNELISDKEQKENQIKAVNEEISDINAKLEQNSHYKRILYTNEEELEIIVREILEIILDYDLSDFVDEKKEDFLIKKDDITFIGEIKGVNSNVKSEFISQLDVHFYSYLDKLRDEGKTESVKALLVMNPFKNKPLEERKKIHDDQIALAKRNESLIITTETLLKLLEAFKLNTITTDQIINEFKTQTGLYVFTRPNSDATEDNSAYMI